MTALNWKEQLLKYRQYLQEEEKSQATIEKYLRDLKGFAIYMEARQISKENVIGYKACIMKGYKQSSVNSILTAINLFLSWLGLDECRVKGLKRHKQIFINEERELNKDEYSRLLRTCRNQKDQRLELIMETICATGIRVSELSSITVTAVKAGRAEVTCKNKTRTIFIPRKLQVKLLTYIRRQKPGSGQVFVTRSGCPVHRSNIWAAMKKLCKAADVSPNKVFPHNLRHLFARTYYQMKKDIIGLADLLGHSQIETTRIYTISTGKEYQRQLETLGLVL